MSYLTKVGSFNIDTTKTAEQTQQITGVGFQPKIVLFWWGGSIATGDSVSGGTYNVGFGAAISSTSRFCMMSISEDAQADTDILKAQYDSEVMRAYTNTGTLDGILDFASMDADGFTLTIDDQFTQAYRVTYLALGGTDLTNVYIGQQQTQTSTGNYSVSGVGFQPDALLIVSNWLTTLTGTGTASNFSLGMTTGSANLGVVGIFAQGVALTSNTTGYGYTGEFMARLTTADAASYRTSLVSLDSDGFTANQLEGTVAYYYYFIALKGGQYSVGDITTRTDGNDIAETVGFQPAALLFASVNRALSTQDTPTSHARLSIGAATSATNRACAAISDEDNLADSETAFANYDSAVYAFVQDDTTVGLMDIKSIDANGFTCVMDDTDPSVCWVTYLAIGAAAASSSPVKYSALRNGINNINLIFTRD